MKREIDYKKEIEHVMKEHLSEFALKVSYYKDIRGFYVELRNIFDSHCISFIARNYSEIYYNLVFFDFGLSYKK